MNQKLNELTDAQRRDVMLRQLGRIRRIGSDYSEYRVKPEPKTKRATTSNMTTTQSLALAYNRYEKEYEDDIGYVPPRHETPQYIQDDIFDAAEKKRIRKQRRRAALAAKGPTS